MRWALAMAFAVGCGSNEMAASGGAGGGHLGTGGSGGKVPDAAIDAPPPDAAIDAAIDARADARADGAFFDAPFFDAPQPDAAGPCDPTQPDGGDGCPNAALPKCAVTFPDPQGNAVLQCEPAGTVQPGGACTRTVDPSGNELAGVDNCINGYCTVFGAATGRICGRYCSATEMTCTSGEQCFEQAPPLPYGVCRTTCDPFGSQSQCPQSNSLGVAQACSWQVLAGETASGAFCSIVGATDPAGRPCVPNGLPPQNCVQGNICLGDNLCHPLCDNTHPCPGGQMCTPPTYLTAGTCDATGNGCPAPETCDLASLVCVVVAPAPNGGGWCIATPDGGGSVILRVHESSRVTGPYPVALRPR